MNPKIKKFFENFIIVAILLVIIQMFLDEYARYAHWNLSIRSVLLVASAVFDIIFSIEFTVRSLYARSSKGFKHYFLYERGWVDLLSSVPLLILDSGPSLFLLITGQLHETDGAFGALQVLKTVKAIRVTRILRLVRVVKIFGKIHNAESKMAQRHTATISTIAVFTIVISLVGFNIFTGSSIGTITEERSKSYHNLISAIEKTADEQSADAEKILESVFSQDEKVVKLYYKGNKVVENVPEEMLRKYFYTDDYIVINQSNYKLYVSLLDVNKTIALQHMENFLMIIFIVLVFMVAYTKHFVQTISDVIHILDKGFRKKDYNLQVKIPVEYADDEIYRLARFYNDAYLPAKQRQNLAKEAKKASGLSMTDLMNFGKK